MSARAAQLVTILVGASLAATSFVRGGPTDPVLPPSPTTAPTAPTAPTAQTAVADGPATWDVLLDNDRAAPAVKRLRMTVTAYCPDACCCGVYADGVTASGRPVTTARGRFVAADTDLLPLGTLLSVPGYAGGRPVEVIDRGAAIRGMRLDVFFADHEDAAAWGVRELDVALVRE